MRLNKARFRAVTEPGFRDAIAAGIPIQRESYASGEPARMVEVFFRERAARKPDARPR
jgi:enoyl-CoA hydratase